MIQWLLRLDGLVPVSCQIFYLAIDAVPVFSEANLTLYVTRSSIPGPIANISASSPLPLIFSIRLVLNGQDAAHIAALSRHFSFKESVLIVSNDFINEALSVGIQFPLSAVIIATDNRITCRKSTALIDGPCSANISISFSILYLSPTVPLIRYYL